MQTSHCSIDALDKNGTDATFTWFKDKKTSRTRKMSAEPKPPPFHNRCDR